jgi:hypothetical protein
MKEIAMCDQAYHFNFCVKLVISNSRNTTLQSFNSNDCAIRKNTLVYYSKCPLSQNVSLTEVVGSLFYLPQAVLLQMAKMVSWAVFT